VSVLNAQEYLGESIGEKTRRQSVNKYESGAEKTQRREQHKEQLPSPSSSAFSLDQQHANCVESLADQMGITTAMKKKTSSPYVGCVEGVTTEYTLRSARSAVSNHKQRKWGKLWNNIKNKAGDNSQSLRDICLISLLITSGCVMYLRSSISSRVRRVR